MSDRETPSGIIRVLPENLANKIAAGEVVQRPASVLKELLENSVDSGAGKIAVVIKKAGSELVQVVDDGSGMSPSDAMVCFHRHATSKISSVEDLERILTLGFRGEALASIASVAQVELRTRRLGDPTGSCVVIHGGHVERSEPCAAPPGTSVAVRNVFYNVPARRNFLKSPSTEFKHLLETFQFIALSHPEIGFSLHHDGREVYDLPVEREASDDGGALSHRIGLLIGSVDLRGLVAVKAATSYLSVTGYITKPEFSRKVRGEQFLFVNGRYVRHRGLEHAVLAAYGEMLPRGAYPFFALFLTLSPRHVDVNVHPTKSEVKFDDENGIYGFLRAAARKALSAVDLTPDYGFKEDGRLTELGYRGAGHPAGRETSGSGYPGTGTPQERVRSSSFSRDLGQSAGGWENYRSLFEIESSVASGPASTSPDSERPESAQDGRDVGLIGQLGEKYLLLRDEDGLVIIDQHAAHERILYERNLRAFEAGESPSQQLLFPHTLELSAPDQALLADLLPDLRALGFDIEFFGGRSVIVRGIPLEIPAGAERSALEEVLDQFREYRDRLQLKDRDNLAKSLACRAAIKTGQRLTRDEVNGLMDALRACEMPHACPHGRPTTIRISLEELDRRFGRVGHLERA